MNSILQKGFLSGMNGCMEHIFAIQSVLGNVRDQALTLFTDLRNAFGSIQTLIPIFLDMLRYIRVP